MKLLIKESVGVCLCLLAALAACGDGTTAELGITLTNTASSSLLYVEPAISNDDAKMHWRWIGDKWDPEMPCPIAGAPFKTRHLFSANPDSQVAATTIPPGLRRFCLYEAPVNYQSPEPTPSQLIALLGQPLGGLSLLRSIEPDHQSVAPFASSKIKDVVQATFSQELDEHADRFSTLPIHVGNSISTGDQTRIALLDTVPTFEPFENPEGRISNSTHGHGLTNIAKNLVCDDSAECTAKISTQLAMPLIRNPGGSLSVDTVRGGYFGSIGWLAEALRSEVRAWQNATGLSEANNNLVMSLSLGWSPDFGGSSGPISSWPLDVQAVYAAVVDAHCRNVLIVSAAGNSTNGPTGNTGPILPAAWEKRNAPTHGECSLALGHDWSPALGFSTTRYKPLLFAASGIDYKGDPIAISREGGLARIAGYADHAVTVDANGDFTATLTGTSVSTVVVAAAAATAWFYRPNEALYTIMQYVYQGGRTVGTRADFCRSSGTPCRARTKRATICGAARRACRSTGPGGFCPSYFGSCSSWNRAPAAVGALDYSGFDSAATDFNFEYALASTGDPACGTIQLAYSKDYSSSSECPDLQFYGSGATPWTSPQPEGDPCPNCVGYISSDEVRLSNPYGFGGYSSPTLSVTNSSGITTNYGLGSLSGTSVNVYFGSSVLSGSRTISFSGISGGVSYSSSLYLGY